MDTPRVTGTLAEARVPLILLGINGLFLAVSGINPPAGHFNWFLEVVPGLAGVVALAVTFRRFPLSRLVYVAVFIHLLILYYGGHYTYAQAPLGDWAKQAFDLSRNHYDRVGHVALGFFPALVIREVLLRATPLRPGGWLSFLICSVALAIGAFWELIEWWTTLLVASDVGEAFLGSQGDVWDAQWDMFLALVGAVVALLALSRIHDRSMAALFARRSGPQAADSARAAPTT